MNEYDNSYDKAETWCRKIIMGNSPLLYDAKLFRETLKETSVAFQFPPQSLISLLRTTHLHAIKITTAAVKRHIGAHMHQYCNGDSILNIARSAAFPPFLMARLLVDEMTIGMGRKELTKIMREPQCITRDIVLPEFDDSKNLQTSAFRLSLEVQEAIKADPLYGPEHDRARHCIGIEYEVALEQTLETINIPYETESQLREKGSARTPDVLLTCPVAFKIDGEWKVVCWIDSKALFGDVTTHTKIVLPQCETYIHRFGPGMIVYWFGHAPIDRLGSANGDIAVVAWRLPESPLFPDSLLLNKKVVWRRHCTRKNSSTSM